MGKLYFDGNGSGSYLVYQLEQDEELDSISLGMLTNNQIPGLASVIYTQMNSTRFIKYNVRSKVTVKQLFSGYVNKKSLLGVLNGMVDAILQSEEYMLYVDNIIFDLDYIFSDVSTYNTVMICLPVIKSNNSIDLLTFFKSIVINLQLENGDYFTKIINYLNSSLNFSAVEFKKLLDGLSDVRNSQLDNKSQIYDGSEYIRSDVGLDSMKAVHNVIVQPQNINNQKLTSNEPAAPVYHSMDISNSPVNHERNQILSSGVTGSDSVETANDEDKISLFYLLQHYNKENAAKYKAQKSAGKASKKGKKDVEINVAKQFTSNSTQNNNFSGVDYAVPGYQQTSFEYNQNTVNSKSHNIVSFQSQNNDSSISQNNVNSQYSANQIQSMSSCAHMSSIGKFSQTADFGETTVLGGVSIGETTVLLEESSQQMIQKPYLIRIKNNERIDIDKPVFKIGKEKSYVDYFINDNAAISRSHATIICREGQYFIIDTNSTNHTYVNGGMIQSNLETLLSHGTKIRFANEEYEFKLY